MAEGDGVYDFCWFPQMSSADPTTCWYAVVRASPQCIVHLAYIIWIDWFVLFEF